MLFFGIFLIAGMVLGKLARMALDDAIGVEAGIGDRLGGATLGAVRVGLVATTLVLIFDQLVPADRQPAFLTGSQLRPLFSAAGQKGFRSLPPDVDGHHRPAEESNGTSRHLAGHPCPSRHAFLRARGPLSGPPRLATVPPSDFKNHLK